MTIQNENARNSYTANGTNTSFAYTFKIFDATDLEVYVGDVLQSSYSVTGAGDDLGGNVIFTTAPSNGETITIIRNEPFTQQIDYVEGDAFPSAAHEQGLDRSVLRDLTLKEIIDRCLTLPVSLSNVSPLLPTPVPNYLLGWNELGTGITNIANVASSQLVTITGGTTERTLANRFTDIASALDYGALGDGTTDDTAAFTALEADYSGRHINLLGKSYVVTSIPTGNIYYGGSFIESGTTYLMQSLEALLSGNSAFTSRTTQADKAIIASDDITLNNDDAYVAFIGCDRGDTAQRTETASNNGYPTPAAAAGASRFTIKSNRGFVAGSTYVDLFGLFNATCLSSRQVEVSGEQGYSIGSRACRNFGTEGVVDSVDRFGQDTLTPMFDSSEADSSVFNADEVYRSGFISCVGVDVTDSSNSVAISSEGTFTLSSGEIQITEAARVAGDRNAMISSRFCRYVADGIVNSTIISSRDCDMGTDSADNVTYCLTTSSEASEFEDSVSYSLISSSSSSNMINTAQRCAIVASSGATIDSSISSGVFADTNATLGNGSNNVASVGCGGSIFSGSSDESVIAAGNGNEVSGGNRNFIAGGTGNENAGNRSGIVGGSDNTINSGSQYALIASSNSVITSGGADNVAILSSQNDCEINNSRSAIFASRRTISNSNGTVVLGDASSGSASTANRNIELNAVNGNIDASGTVSGSVTFTDFAEMFENYTKGVISVGTIVTLEGDKIKPANGVSGILGVISATAGIILGDSKFHWSKRWLIDEFGAKKKEKVKMVRWNSITETLPFDNTVIYAKEKYGDILPSHAEYYEGTVNKNIRMVSWGDKYEKITNSEEGKISVEEVSVIPFDGTLEEARNEFGRIPSYASGYDVIKKIPSPFVKWEGIPYLPAFNGVIEQAKKEFNDIPSHAEYYEGEIFVENPNYIPPEEGKENVARSDRPEEWSVVGMIGQVYVRIGEGQIRAGDYLRAVEGIGYHSDEETKLRVMKVTTPFDVDKGYGVAKCVLN